MHWIGRRFILPVMIMALFAVITGQAYASNIFVKENRAIYYTDKVFLENAELLKKPIIIQYFGENSVSIILADQATINENEIVIPKGEQFILDHNGKVSQRLKFENTKIDNTLGIEMAGTFIEGQKAMVKFDGLFTTLLIEELDNGRRKVSLAQKSEFDDATKELHMFDGYTLTVDKDNNLEEQTSFRETAFGGTLKTQIDAASSFVTNQTNPGTQPGMNPLLHPGGSDVDPQIQFDTLEYEVPKLKKIALIPFKDQAEIKGYEKYIPELFQDQLGKDVEIVIPELTDAEKDGIYLFNRAAKFGEKYGVDGILQGRIRRLEELGTSYQKQFSKETRITCELEGSLVDTIRGKYLWKNVAKYTEFVNSTEYQGREETILVGILRKAINSLARDIKEKKALDGGKVR
jgi:hypothetical protein